MKSINLTSILFILTIVLSSCKKEKKDNQEIAPTGNLIFHLHSNIDVDEVENKDSIYLSSEGRDMSIDLAQMFITGIQLVKLDGSTLDLSSKFLKTIDVEAYKIENVPVGNYKAIRFNVGLDATTNALDATNLSLLNNSTMWFSSTYQPNENVFFYVKGTIDTTSNKNGLQIPFEYKIGTNSNLVKVNIPEQNFTIQQNLDTYSHIIIDYSKVFDGVILNQSGNLFVETIQSNSSVIALKIRDNISNLFRFN